MNTELFEVPISIGSVFQMVGLCATVGIRLTALRLPDILSGNQMVNWLLDEMSGNRTIDV